MKKIIFIMLFIMLNVGQGQVFVASQFWQDKDGSLSISDTPSYAFGSIPRNTNYDKTFTVTNNSATSITIGIVANSFSTAVFSFKGGTYPGTGGTCGNSLQRAATCTIVITANSSSLGFYIDAISLNYKTRAGLGSLSLPLSAQVDYWSPVHLGANLQLWLDASDNATVRTGASGVSQAASGDPVSVWQDKSGNGYNATQTTGGNQPTFSPAGWTGSRSTIVFNNGSHGLTVTGMTWQAYSFGLVINHVTNTSVRAILTKRSGVGTGFFFFLYDSYSGNMTWDQNGGRYNTGFLPTLNTDYVYSIVRPLVGTNRSQYVNGTINGTTSTNTDHSNNLDLTIGNDFSSGSRGASAKFSEFVVANTNLSTTDRQRLEGYLAWKWGIEGSLPGAHPYKSAAP